MDQPALQSGGRRDHRVIAYVCGAHFVSHIYMFGFAPLLPLMARDLDVSFLQLGAAFSLFFLASGCFQPVAGLLIDRVGAPRVLLAGLALQAAAIAAMAFVPTYTSFAVIAAFAGLGNSVYHPANLTIISTTINSQRQGRAFAFHTTAASAANAIAPVLLAAIALTFGWRAGLLATGTAGMAFAFLLWVARTEMSIDQEPLAATRAKAAFLSSFRALAKPTIAAAFIYMVLTAFAGVGVQQFGITALSIGYETPIASATVIIALYQVGAVGGILTGGLVAERRSGHLAVALIGLGTGALLLILFSGVQEGIALRAALITTAGFAIGLTAPSRDVLVRQAAPRGATGATFGIVYSGFDLGSLIAPIAFGIILDHSRERLVFVLAAMVLVVAMLALGLLRGGSSIRVRRDNQ